MPGKSETYLWIYVYCAVDTNHFQNVCTRFHYRTLYTHSQSIRMMHTQWHWWQWRRRQQQQQQQQTLINSHTHYHVVFCHLILSIYRLNASYTGFIFSHTVSVGLESLIFILQLQLSTHFGWRSAKNVFSFICSVCPQLSVNVQSFLLSLRRLSFNSFSASCVLQIVWCVCFFLFFSADSVPNFECIDRPKWHCNHVMLCSYHMQT